LGFAVAFDQHAFSISSLLLELFTFGDSLSIFIKINLVEQHVIVVGHILRLSICSLQSSNTSLLFCSNVEYFMVVFLLLDDKSIFWVGLDMNLLWWGIRLSLKRFLATVCLFFPRWPWKSSYAFLKGNLAINVTWCIYSTFGRYSLAQHTFLLINYWNIKLIDVLGTTMIASSIIILLDGKYVSLVERHLMHHIFIFILVERDVIVQSAFTSWLLEGVSQINSPNSFIIQHNFIWNDWPLG